MAPGPEPESVGPPTEAPELKRPPGPLAPGAPEEPPEPTGAFTWPLLLVTLLAPPAAAST